MNYGKAIRICRTAKGWTQAKLARQTSVGPSQLSLIESGDRQPTVKTISEICEALNVPPHLLTLLASEPEDFARTENEPEVKELARLLLHLLGPANDEPRQLPLEP